MADQAINALSTKTAPETSDQLLLVGAGEPQLIDYDKLADAILNKITSKNYALDAGQMTLLAALNKLNSESLIGNVTTIDDITFDYNSFTKTGLYYINGPKNQSESDNKPGENITNCFMMVLAKTDYRCFQIIFPGNTERIFYRNTKTDTSGWNSWKTL
nr:MAG TPA: putative tail fiber protein [Caudoviricetes sp.]